MGGQCGPGQCLTHTRARLPAFIELRKDARFTHRRPVATLRRASVGAIVPGDDAVKVVKGQQRTQTTL